MDNALMGRKFGLTILDNECTHGTKIIIESGNLAIKQNRDVVTKPNGIGGITDDGQVVGIYIDKGNAYFLYNRNSTLILRGYFEVDNQYISEEERLFKVRQDNEVLCEIKYKPYIDPGLIIYDSEEDEFDFLLRFYKMLKDSESLDNCINYIKRLSV